MICISPDLITDGRQFINMPQSMSLFLWYLPCLAVQGNKQYAIQELVILAGICIVQVIKSVPVPSLGNCIIDLMGRQ